jgi:hypothetical protein
MAMGMGLAVPSISTFGLSSASQIGSANGQSELSPTLIAKAAKGFLHASCREWRNLAFGNRHKKGALPDERDGKGGGLDLDPAVSASDIHDRPRLDSRLLADLLRDNQAPSCVNRHFHDIDCTSRYHMVLWMHLSVLIRGPSSGCSKDEASAQTSWLIR